MPAKSKSQQRLFGMVHAYQKGKLKHAPASVKRIAKHISKSDARHFAKTKHKDLPEKTGEYSYGFLSKCAEHGVPEAVAMRMLKLAEGGKAGGPTMWTTEGLKPYTPPSLMDEYAGRDVVWRGSDPVSKGHRTTWPDGRSETYSYEGGTNVGWVPGTYMGESMQVNPAAALREADRHDATERMYKGLFGPTATAAGPRITMDDATRRSLLSYEGGSPRLTQAGTNLVDIAFSSAPGRDGRPVRGKPPARGQYDPGSSIIRYESVKDPRFLLASWMDPQNWYRRITDYDEAARILDRSGR